MAIPKKTRLQQVEEEKNEWQQKIKETENQMQQLRNFLDQHTTLPHFISCVLEKKWDELDELKELYDFELDCLNDTHLKFY